MIFTSKTYIILETSIIFFPPKTPQKAMRHYLLRNNTASATISPPTSKQVNYSSRDNPRQPKTTKMQVNMNEEPHNGEENGLSAPHSSCSTTLY
jgi:hypothetical protein